MALADNRNILVTPAQMREIDTAITRDYGIPGLILMESAASGIADYIIAHADELMPPTAERSVLAVCGKGNNGGDGFAVARKLFHRDFGVLILVLADRSEIENEAKVNLEICERLGIDIIFANKDTIGDILPFCLARAELIIDAIFGAGFRGRTESVNEIAIRAINESHKKVVSVDIPSGLDGQSGTAGGECVRADVTLALGLLKMGLMTGPDISYAGKVELIDFGIPDELIEKAAWNTRLVCGRNVGALLTPRRRNTHKGDYGKLMIVTGSPGMTGAGCLAAEAALTAGAGLVYLAVPGALAQIYETAVRETVTLCAGTNVEGIINYECADAISSYSGRMDAVAIGPGMSNEAETARAIRRILTSIGKPVVIDADALSAVATDISILERLKAPAVLTPHEAEMARLLGTAAANVTRNRLSLAREFASKLRVVIVLKGHHTIVAMPDGRALVNTTGNPGMATAGAGDVLTGIIAAFIGMGMPAGDAAAAGVHLHGLAGDCAAGELGERSVRASDIIRYMPAAFRKLA